MNEISLKEYEIVRGNGAGFYEQKRGLIEVWGAEAVMFLNGLITNDVKTLAENSWMLAAFPNAQGRLLAAVRVLKIEDKFIFETEAETYEKVLQNLSRFTLAGDFKVQYLTEEFSCVSIRGDSVQSSKFVVQGFGFPTSETETVTNVFNCENVFVIHAFRANGFDVFVPKISKESFIDELKNLGAVEIGEEAQEVLRVENGEPKYGADMDETTIVPELGIDGLISYNKGCYIGQEIIARIHFRGHVAKKLTGLVFEESVALRGNEEIKSFEGRNAGKITSTVFSPKLDKQIALAYVRYDYLAEDTKLKVNEMTVKVKNLPFI
ncbi:MAG TPA: glycine cleavage T C-terminal barrel domain-containing protein [Pyrinomonadaceae bacterium]|nr:glycine cleavage T C-terminal barrel domain-containing protein [Pyrinomonadaceae bacterium]